VQQHQKTVWYTAISSPIGKLYLAVTDRGIARIMIGSNKVKPLFLDELQVLAPTCSIRENPVPFRNVIKVLEKYFSGKEIDIISSKIPFDFSSGTPFQQKVWKTLCRIPYGQVRSYQWVAEQIKEPDAVRAVGQANGKNPLPILVPCHRVINKDGTLGGYSGGTDIKKKLLKLEGIIINAKCQNPNAK
jgi:O-6-methylguanine DNA methyltransferase